MAGGEEGIENIRYGRQREGRWTPTRVDPRAAESAAGRKKSGLAAGKIVASRQPGRKKNAVRPPPNFRLKAALPRDVNKKLICVVIMYPLETWRPCTSLCNH